MPSQMDVATWCYMLLDGRDRLWFGSSGGVRYRAPYDANNRSFQFCCQLREGKGLKTIEKFSKGNGNGPVIMQ